MRLKVLYFAALREAMGQAEEVVDAPADITTVGALRVWLAERDVRGAALAAGRALRAARNQDMAQEATTLAEGDEIAFFPPVTGG